MPCSEDDDSQSGFASEPSQGMSKAELRKTNKPIMEKKRRARINHCLNELKELLTEYMETDPARHSKLEKADILEMTVKHLQNIQRHQLAAAIAADPAVLLRFQSGFGDCAVEVRRYLARLASSPPGLRHRLSHHLESCLSGISRFKPSHEHALVPDPLRLDDDRPSAFHFVNSTRPASPPLSPSSCDSACDSSTELETPPRIPPHNLPFPTPPSRSASDQDSSPETQKPTVSSTTISPESLKQETVKPKKYMEPLSIVIDVENYKIGIDASPKRAVDYSRPKLKRPIVGCSGPAPKQQRTETFIAEYRVSKDKVATETRTSFMEKGAFVAKSVSEAEKRMIPEKPVPVKPVEMRRPFAEARFGDSTPTTSDRLVPLPKIVIRHTAESLAESSQRPRDPKVKEKAEADTSTKSPEQSTSANTEMWRPW